MPRSLSESASWVKRHKRPQNGLRAVRVVEAQGVPWRRPNLRTTLKSPGLGSPGHNRASIKQPQPNALSRTAALAKARLIQSERPGHIDLDQSCRRIQLPGEQSALG